MNSVTLKLYEDYLARVGDPSAAACLTLADTLQTDQTPSQSLTVRDVAHRLGVSSRVAYELCQDGEINSFKVGRSVRVHPDELTAYVERHTDRGPVFNTRRPQ